MDNGINNCMDVVNDIIKGYTDRQRFWKEGEMEQALKELICSMAWHDEIEAYEYLSYTLDMTYLAVRKFEKAEKDFWLPILHSYFNGQKHILEDNNAEGRKTLTNYFPLTSSLSDCKDTLSKLKTLVVINKQTNGTNSAVVNKMAKEYYDSLVDAFDELGEPNRYMSEKDLTKTYKTLILTGLSAMTTLENVSSSQSDIRNIQKADNVITTQLSSSVPTAEVSAEQTKPLNIKAGQTSVTVTEVVSLTTEKKDSEKDKSDKALKVIENGVNEDMGELNKVEENPIESVEFANPEDNINIYRINALIEANAKDDKGYTLEDYVRDFGNEYRDLVSRYYYSLRQKSPKGDYEAEFYHKKLKDMFKNFNNWYDKAKSTKPHRGIKPDMQKWDELRKDIADFVKKNPQPQTQKG